MAEISRTGHHGQSAFLSPWPLGCCPCWPLSPA